MHKNIMAEMARNGLTRSIVAKELGLSLHSFHKKLSGKTDFKESEIKILLSLFGNNISYEYLFAE